MVALGVIKDVTTNFIIQNRLLTWQRSQRYATDLVDNIIEIQQVGTKLPKDMSKTTQQNP